MADRKAKGPTTSASSSLYERYKDALRRGHVAALRGKLEPAIAAYSEAASIAADRALPHAAIGGILVRMGRIPEALAAFDRALELAPRDETSLRGRAEALRSLGQRVEAAEALDRLAAVLEAGGRLPDACDAVRRALELAESKDRRRHVESLAARLREMPGDEPAERALAAALRFLGPSSTLQAGAAGESTPEPEPEPEPEREPDPIALAAAAEQSLDAGDHAAAREGLLAAAGAYRRSGRSLAAIDACYLALAIAPADVDLHLMLTEIYLESGWRGPAVDKLLLLGRLAEIEEDPATRERLCRLVGEQLADEPRLAALCA